MDSLSGLSLQKYGQTDGIQGGKKSFRLAVTTPCQELQRSQDVQGRFSKGVPVTIILYSASI